ncbi:MAG: serine protein kinase PrkA [Oligoflexia bacterium]|nr:serine protein kinase PrkA [Oligoflexia bacterium]
MNSISKIHDSIKSDYEQQNRILSFDEYLDFVRQHSKTQTRSSSQYMLDMFDYFGKSNGRFHLFDQKFIDERYRLVGHEAVQEQVYQILKRFVQEGLNNKLVLLHGPNGSAKTSFIACIMRGLEEYSNAKEGAVYRFHWVFPADRFGKPGLGFASKDGKQDESIESFAKLPDVDIAARISCELRDHPLFLIPLKERSDYLDSLDLSQQMTLSEYIRKGDLSQKSKKIFEALLRSYKGDYKKVLRHIQVERFYISKRYRDGAVTIEPQMHVDAMAQQLTMDKSVTMLPSSLHFLSLFDLGGDLVDGNRGIIEYNDLLKRPIDAFKYLLTTTETGTVSIAGTTAFIDSVMMGTCNEAQLDAFKEYPDFPSFQARIELVRASYLLDYRKEQEIYQGQIKRLVGDRHVAPHVFQAAAMWAVLCRLKKPTASNYSSSHAYLVNSLTPMEKLKLYGGGAIPSRLSSDEKKTLKSLVNEIKAEYESVPYYEGRVGPSPREMKIILFNAIARSEKGMLSPLGLFLELEDFIKRTTEYEYLRLEVIDGYHDCKGFIHTIREEYLDQVDAEVRSCLGLHDEIQYEGFLKKYVAHLNAFLKKEKIHNPKTGAHENPDKFLMDEFEKVVGVGEDKEAFRKNVLTQLGVYALENPGLSKDGMDYRKVFPDLLEKIRDYYIDEHSQLLKKIYDVITLFEQRESHTSQSDSKIKTIEQQEIEGVAVKMLGNMKDKYGYSEASAREAFFYLVQKRY